MNVTACACCSIYLAYLMCGCSDFPDAGDERKVASAHSLKKLRISDPPSETQIREAIGTVVELEGRVSHVVAQGGAASVTIGEVEFGYDEAGTLKRDASKAVLVLLARSEGNAAEGVRKGDVIRVRGLVKEGTVYRCKLDGAIFVH
jgi:hypothetical protein